jgi:hypothetical protein
VAAIYRSVGTRSQSASAATISPALPTVDGNNAKGKLLAVVTSKNNATHSCATSGWSQVGSQVNSGASFTASVWQAAEGAGAPTITWTGAVACSAQIAYYSDGQGVMDTGFGASTSNTGATATHSTVSINTTRNNALVLYIDVAAANTALATPSGWTENVDAGSGTDVGRTVWGSKSVATSGSASGAISVTGANAAWVQFQIELYADQATNQIQVSKAELAAMLDVPDGYATSKAELGAWLDAPTEAGFSKAELGAWLDFIGTSIRRRQSAFIN